MLESKKKGDSIVLLMSPNTIKLTKPTMCWLSSQNFACCLTFTNVFFYGKEEYDVRFWIHWDFDLCLWMKKVNHLITNKGNLHDITNNSDKNWSRCSDWLHYLCKCQVATDLPMKCLVVWKKKKCFAKLKYTKYLVCVLKYSLQPGV